MIKETYLKTVQVPNLIKDKNKEKSECRVIKGSNILRNPDVLDVCLA